MRTVPRSQIANEFTPGCVIWRPLRVYNGIMYPELGDVTVQHQEGKTSFVRTQVDGYGQGVPEPVINSYRGKGKQYGIITFLRANVPDCWTHCVVTSIGRGMNCLNVIPECLPDIEAYIRWRMQLETLYADRSINTNAGLAARVAAYPCPGFRADRKRLQVFPAQDDGYHVEG